MNLNVLLFYYIKMDWSYLINGKAFEKFGYPKDISNEQLKELGINPFLFTLYIVDSPEDEIDNVLWIQVLENFVNYCIKNKEINMENMEITELEAYGLDKSACLEFYDKNIDIDFIPEKYALDYMLTKLSEIY